MRSKKPFSTVSYNTKDFLLLKFKEMTDNRVVANWMFIYHHAEEDEGSDHFHVYVEPNKLIDTMWFCDQFVEFDPKHPDKPLKCRPCRPSKVDKEYHPDDWILYNLHDPKYLAWKGESRKYHYTKDDIVCFDHDLLEDNLYHALYQSDWAEELRQRKEVKDCRNVSELYYSGRIPAQLIVPMRALKQEEALENSDKVERNGRVTHTPLFRPRKDWQHN